MANAQRAAQSMEPIYGKLPIPEHYPGKSHARLHCAAHDYLKRATVGQRVQSEFRAAWKGVVHRFIAAEECASAFAESVRSHGDAPKQPERYRQDRDFFNFVVNSVACLENLHYAIYAWGACLRLPGFCLEKEEDRKKVSDNGALRAVRGVADAWALADVMQYIHDSRPYTELRNARIVLFHRCLPGRYISASSPGPPSEPSRYAGFGDKRGPDITPGTAAHLLNWLAGCLQRAIPLAADWVERTASA